MTKNTLIAIIVVLLSLLSNTGEAQKPLTRMKFWWCVARSDNRKPDAKDVAFMDQTSNEAEEEAIRKKEKPGSNVCPVGYEWEEMPIDQNLPQASTATPVQSSYYQFGQSNVTRVGSGQKDGRSDSEMIAQAKQLPADLGSNKKEFEQRYGNRSLKPMWDVMLLRAYLFLGLPTFTRGSKKLPVEARLQKILERVGKVRARIVTESSGDPHSVSDAGAMGLTQIMPSTVRSFCPNENLADPFVQIWCGTAEEQNKANQSGGNAIDTDLAYVAGPGRLNGMRGDIGYRAKAEKAGLGRSSQGVMKFLENGGSHAGEISEEGLKQQKKAKKVAYYVTRNHALWAIYVKDNKWFYDLLEMREFAFLKKP